MSGRLEALRSESKRKSLRFWNEPEEDAHATLTGWVDFIRGKPAYTERKRENLLYLSLYTNKPIIGFGLNSYSRSSVGTRVSLNVTQNVTDTLISQIVKIRPKPTIITTCGDYEARAKAEAMQDSVSAIMYDKHFYDIANDWIADACTYGLGLIKIFEHPGYGDIAIERTYPWELIIDEREAMYGSPRTIVQRKYYDKQVLIEQFVKSREDLEEDQWDDLVRAIESAGVDADQDELDYDTQSDQVCVYEGWHLRSGPNATDGKHIICIRGATFLMEEYNKDYFPFVELRPPGQRLGYYGIGTCEKLVGIQIELNRMLRDIQTSMHLIAKPHWMVEMGSKVTKQHINNDIATIMNYSGTAPVVYTPQAMSPDVYAHAKFLYATSFEICGVSQLAAQSQKPAGLNSGVALRAYQDVQTDRFVAFVRSYEDSTRLVAERIIDLVRGIAKKNRRYQVTTITKEGLKTVNWSEVDLKDAMTVKVLPSSMLPDTIPGKLAFVDDLRQMMEIDPDQALDLLAFPDIEQFTRRAGAPRRIIERNISAMMNGVPVMPEPMDNHALAVKLVTEAYQDARSLSWDNDKGVPEENLELMRRYTVASQHFLNPPAPEPPTGGAPFPPGAPGGALPPGMPPEMPLGMPPEAVGPPSPMPVGAAPPAEAPPPPPPA